MSLSSNYYFVFWPFGQVFVFWPFVQVFVFWPFGQVFVFWRFVQVDSHDLRFPWIAFFTTTYVKAGTELVWDYNYEVCSSNVGKLLIFWWNPGGVGAGEEDRLLLRGSRVQGAAPMRILLVLWEYLSMFLLWEYLAILLLWKQSAFVVPLRTKPHQQLLLLWERNYFS